MDNWKDPIDTVIPVNELNDMRDACAWFTGSELYVVSQLDNEPKFRVKAEGYYNAVEHENNYKTVYKFRNGYSASVVCNPTTYGYSQTFRSRGVDKNGICVIHLLLMMLRDTFLFMVSLTFSMILQN